jgi:hypothetical protein
VLSKDLTFDQARNILIDRAGLPGLPAVSSLPNARAAMDNFLQSLGLQWHTVIGPTLRGSFQALVTDYRQALLADGSSLGHSRNRVWLLGKWVKLINMLDYESAISASAPSPFAENCQLLFKEGSHKLKAALKGANILPSQFRRWRAGKGLPMRGQLPRLAALEQICNKPTGYLIDRLPFRSETYNAKKSKRLPSQSKSKIKRRQLRKDHYRLSPAKMFMNGILVAQWTDLVHERSKHAARGEDSSFVWTEEKVKALYGTPENELDKVWRLRLLRDGEKPRWWNCVDGHYCPTAQSHFSSVAMILGWAQKPLSEGGLGLAFADLSLALCADYRIVLKFSGWRIARSEKPTMLDYNFLISVGSMLAPWGYLTMNPQFGERFGITVPEEWLKHCATARAEIWKAVNALEDRVVETAKAEEALKGILELESPLSAIVRGVRNLKLNKASYPGAKQKFWGRELLLFSLTMSNPLRVENLSRLTYRSDNSGHVRKTVDGWQIVISKSELKNLHGEAKDKHYDQPIDPYVWPFLEEYLEIHRPKFGNPSDYLFVPDSARTDSLYWGNEAMSDKYRRLLQQYVPECPEGYGLNAPRHIVATHIVVTTGNYIHAAHMLHNKVKTTQRSYAHVLEKYHERQRAKTITPLLSGLADHVE